MIVPVQVRAFAPGRVNVIGEHTDYNDGLCLPFAVGPGVTVTARATGGDEVRVRAEDLGEQDAFAAGGPERAPGWRAHPRGVVAELAALGVELPGGAEVSIAADLPSGAGLSSSAALDVALALALLGLAGRDLEPVEIARLAQRVEHDWVGARTGLLDQLASLRGAPGHAVRLDMRTLAATPVPLELAGWTWAVLDSGERHELAESGYNDRRDECAAALEALGLDSLRDATEAGAAGLPDPLDRRVRHVVTENARVEAAVAALAAGDGARTGALLDASHASLRDDYEVSTAAVEATVERLRAAGAAGARIMGGGFGGSAIALFAPGTTPPADALVVEPSAGARRLDDGS
jgi:galactokinase